MKRLMIFSLILLILTGCSYDNNVAIQSATVMIHSSPINDVCLLQVYPDGTLDVTFGNLFNSSKEELINGKYRINDTKRGKRKTKKLSKKEMKNIDSLITKVKEENCFEEPWESDPSIAVVIDGEYFFTKFNDSIPYNNNNDALRELTYELVELSPIKVLNGWNAKKREWKW